MPAWRWDQALVTRVRRRGLTCSSRQFQDVLRNSLKQADLVTEIPLGQEKIFLSSRVSTTTALSGPTFVDDDPAASQRHISHKVSVATTGYLQAVKTVFSRRQCPRELRIRAVQALVESGPLSEVTLSQLAKRESVRSRVLRKF